MNNFLLENQLSLMPCMCPSSHCKVFEFSRVTKKWMQALAKTGSLYDVNELCEHEVTTLEALPHAYNLSHDPI